VASAFAHYPTEDVELSGVRIRAGEPVLVSLAAANRDTGAFEDPNTLRLDRTQNPHLGFGHGFHHCLGAHLARIELQETLTVLLDAFPDLRLAVPPKDVPWKRGMFLRGPSALPIAW
jgi:nocardicin N-oxygenase